MKRLLSLVFLVVFLSEGAQAQISQYFEGRDQLIPYVQSTCKKFWNKSSTQSVSATDVTVYTQDCALYFEVKQYIECAKDTKEPCTPKVLNTLYKINLEDTKLLDDKGMIVLAGANKTVTTLSFVNTGGWEHKADFSKSFTVPLTYNDSKLQEELKKLREAFQLLLMDCAH